MAGLDGDEVRICGKWGVICGAVEGKTEVLFGQVCEEVGCDIRV